MDRTGCRLKRSHTYSLCVLKAFSWLIRHLTKFRTQGVGGPVTVLLLPQGYIASRMFARRACYILKMDREAIPALDELKQYIYERQVNISCS